MVALGVGLAVCLPDAVGHGLSGDALRVARSERRGCPVRRLRRTPRARRPRPRTGSGSVSAADRTLPNSPRGAVIQTMDASHRQNHAVAARPSLRETPSAGGYGRPAVRTTTPAARPRHRPESGLGAIAGGGARTPAASVAVRLGPYSARPGGSTRCHAQRHTGAPRHTIAWKNRREVRGPVGRARADARTRRLLSHGSVIRNREVSGKRRGRIRARERQSGSPAVDYCRRPFT